MNEFIIPDNAKAISGRDLPPLDRNLSVSDNGSILLFYQYIEPEWTNTQHKIALKKVIEIGTKFHITGRGRVAREGLNCTLTGKPSDVRSFCHALREWDDVFQLADFKITDGLPLATMFKSLSIRKTNELVAYGLVGKKAPSLKKFGGTHLDAQEYHEAMKDPDAVIIDVRNAYESAIGHFQPPKSGAKLLDPKMRNSVEFPKWLNSEDTQKLIRGKKVLMYCTGGIRCERATALLNQMTAVQDDLDIKGVFHCRGGIERYVKTFVEGGYWKGKNYLFDRRMEQIPQIKSSEEVEKEIESKCCVCQVRWTLYRGKFECHGNLCGVPVIVCDSCVRTATDRPRSLICKLCREGYRAPSEVPDLVDLKRKADEIVKDSMPESPPTSFHHIQGHTSKRNKSFHSDRVFLRRLPLTATFAKVKEAIGPTKVLNLKWLADKSNQGFYGSAIVQLYSTKHVDEILDMDVDRIRVDGRRIKVAHVLKKDGDSNIFDACFEPKEYPPVGTS